MANVAFIFIVIFWILIIIPCIGAAWVGVQLINRLGRAPSKTPAIQMSILLKLVIVETVSFALILTFFKALVSE